MDSHFYKLKPTDDAGEIAAAVETAYNSDYTVRRTYALLWEEGLRFLTGEQWTHLRRDASSVGASWESTSPATSRLGPVTQPRTNFILPAVRALVSMLVKNLPQGKATPKRDDPSRVVARAAEKLLEALDEENDEAVVKATVALWSVCTGTGVKKNFVEEVVPFEVDRYVRTPDSPDPIEGEDGEPEVADGPETEKWLSSAALSPFQIAVDPNATSPQDLSWVMETSVHSISWIKTALNGPDGEDKKGWTGRADEVQPEKDLTSPLSMWYRLKFLGPTWLGFWHSTARGIDLEDAAVVKEVYIKPDKDRPDGLMAIVANNVPLYVGKIPYLKARRWHPYSFTRFFPFPGRFWGMGAIEQISPMQRRVNGIDAFTALVRATILAPKVLLPRGSTVQGDYITGVPGQIIEYNAAMGQPTVLQMGALPPDIWKERENAVEEIKFVAGTVDPLGGDRAEGVPSYSGQALLYERATDAHGLTFLEWEKFLENDAEMRVQFSAYLLDEGENRLSRLVRDGLKIQGAEERQFRLADLRDSVVIRVESGSSVPRSRVLHQQGVFELAQGQLLDMSNPEVRFKFLELFGAGEFEKEGHTLRKAQLENAMLLSGEDVQHLFLPDENQALHIQEHERCLEENLDHISKEIRQRAEAHLGLHKQAFQQQQMQAAQGVAPPAPGPGAGGLPTGVGQPPAGGGPSGLTAGVQ